MALACGPHQHLLSPVPVVVQRHLVLRVNGLRLPRDHVPLEQRRFEELREPIQRALKVAVLDIKLGVWVRRGLH
jgi:hypothetical protein